jgi:lipoprotein-anchoring transpeptidase ErfK/SrfK
MPSRKKPLTHSFVCLSFVTAALLIAVQLRAISSKAETPKQPAFASSFVDHPDRLVEAAVLPASPALAAFVRPGLSLNVQTTLNPNALARRSELVVDLSDRQVYLFQGGEQVANYAVAVGQAGWETPPGQFHVISMITDPTWQHPFTGEIFPSGTENPLGSRWIGFWTDGTHQIGLHGTNQVDLIGQAVSHGCIRMRDEEIQALYAQVAIGTEVTVRP